ncbi:hypothetical protein CWC11_20125 [Pseudoalteromonas sp. S3178]|nr:hypothetical protein CWC11_20125 [Pseudoalteromonas sp. S3178]
MFNTLLWNNLIAAIVFEFSGRGFKRPSTIKACVGGISFSNLFKAVCTVFTSFKLLVPPNPTG